MNTVLITLGTFAVVCLPPMTILGTTQHQDLCLFLIAFTLSVVFSFANLETNEYGGY